MSGLTLYQVGEELQALDQLLAECEGEWTPEIEAWFAEYGALEAAKVDGYVGFIKDREAYAAACKAAEDQLAAKRKVAERAIERLKAHAKAVMDLQGKTELKGTIWRLAIQKNGGKPPLKLAVEPEQLPRHYQTIAVSANTDALREALAAGDEEAAQLAALQPVGTHLRIR